MNGDGKPDLVVSADCGTTATLGQDHWLVYLNTGSGFATSPITWPTPNGDFSWGLANYTCGKVIYATADMNDDGKPDLVIAADCGTTTSTLGQDHWLVYLNTGSGFAASSLTWPTPNGDFSWGLANYTCGKVIYATADMNGDRKPDLVISSDCGTTGTLGQDHWLVYLNACH
jgi:hypothetical protein